MSKKFDTIFPAVAVPFNEDNTINETEFRNYLDWVVSYDGIDGVVCNGHTGEITGLTAAERKRVTEIVHDEVGDKVTVVSGVSSESTAGAIQGAKDAKAAGADGILLMPPHMWLRFGFTEESAFQFVKDISDQADIDIIIHLYPATSKAFYPLDLLLRMCKEISHVKAVKMGTRVQSVYEREVRALRKESPETKLLTCHDEYILSSLFPGMDGAVLGFAACIPELITAGFKAYYQDDWKKIHDIDDRIYAMANVIYHGGQPSGEAHARLKEVLVQRGIFSNALMRKPVMPLSKEVKDNIANGVKLSGVEKVNLIK